MEKMYAQKFSTNNDKQDKTLFPFKNTNHHKKPCKPTFADMLKRGSKNHKTFLSNEKRLNKGEQSNENNEQLIESNNNKFISSQYGYKFEDKYLVGHKLGQGGQGSVYTGESCVEFYLFIVFNKNFKIHNIIKNNA